MSILFEIISVLIKKKKIFLNKNKNIYKENFVIKHQCLSSFGYKRAMFFG
jgi:hypothetical protein